MIVHFGCCEERAVAPFIDLVGLILLQYEVLAVRHQLLKPCCLHLLKLQTARAVHSQNFLNESLHFSDVIRISRLVMQAFEVRKPLEFVSVEIEEYLGMLALYSCVLF